MYCLLYTVGPEKGPWYNQVNMSTGAIFLVVLFGSEARIYSAPGPVVAWSEGPNLVPDPMSR